METEGIVEVPSVFAVSTEKEIDTKTATNELLEKILSRDNMNIAFGNNGREPKQNITT